MLHIYGMNITPLTDRALFEECLLKIDAVRREKVLACKNQKDRCLSLGCSLLLQKAAKEAQDAGGLKKGLLEMVQVQDAEYFQELEYGMNKDGKPFWKNVPKTAFNLSHSGSYAVCGVSRRQLGVDIQQLRPIRQGIARRFYTQEEQELLENAGSDMERENIFFRIWTVKESYVKLAGRGMSMGFDSFEVDITSHKVRATLDKRELAVFAEFSVEPGYCGSIVQYSH